MPENEKSKKTLESPAPEPGEVKPDGPAATATTEPKTPETPPPGQPTINV